MKTTQIGVCLLGFWIFSSWAQVPNAPQSAVQLPPPAGATPGVIPIRTNSIIRPLTSVPGTTGTTGGDLSRSTAPRAITAPRSNSIVNPSPASTNLSGFTVINPAPRGTNEPGEEIIQP